MKMETVRIEKIGFGGEGVARLSNGKIIFVPFVLPGELVKVLIREEYKDYAVGEFIEVIEESEARVAPLCKYYRVCGGCHFQHMTYQREIQIKEGVLRELFLRQAQRKEIPLKEVIPSPKEYFYRNRLRLHVENHSLKMGFVKRKSHEVLKIEECIISNDLINQVLKELYQCQAWINLSLYSKRIKLEVSLLEEKVSILFWSLVDPKSEDIAELIKLNHIKSVFYIRKGQRPQGPYPKDASFGGRKLLPALYDLIYYVQPGVFTQTNWEINLLLMEKVVSLSQGAEKILDLHSGMGNFLFPLVKKLTSAKEFLGVDTDIRAIEDAIYIAEKNEINGKVDFTRMSALEALYEKMREGERYDLILLDPPRGGCKELIRYLPEVAKDKIIYISCDPPTLVRDILLLEKVGFILRELYLFDMFPRTYHFETLALLQRKD
ncbi:MAG: 23S rRNA (uracil(1939)-C(5))-methyltransferase RlmD [Caldimicrobium sp.]